MRITQGAFSFLPDLTDDEIRMQLEYCLDHGWAVSVEYTDDPHPRNTYWEMWGLPMFDLADAAGIMDEIHAVPRDPSATPTSASPRSTPPRGVESVALSFIVQRPADEPGFRLERQEGPGRRAALQHRVLRRRARPGGRALWHRRRDTDDARDTGAVTPAAPATIDLAARVRGLGHRRGARRARPRPRGARAGEAPRPRDRRAAARRARARPRGPRRPSRRALHMCFTGNPGTGKTTVAMRMAEMLHRLGYVRKGHVVAVTRDDLVGQYIGHTAPKTKDVLKRAMGGVLFIDEAYYLHRPENEKDYGQEAIEILLQVMENQRDDLVVILAGYADRMDAFFESNPGMASRIAHHVEFPDYTDDELLEIAERMLAEMELPLRRRTPRPRSASTSRIRRTRPHFANARSVRNALDRFRLRQALRLFEARGAALTTDDLAVIREPEVRASRLFDEDDARAAAGRRERRAAAPPQHDEAR